MVGGECDRRAVVDHVYRIRDHRIRITDSSVHVSIGQLGLNHGRGYLGLNRLIGEQRRSHYGLGGSSIDTGPGARIDGDDRAFLNHHTAGARGVFDDFRVPVVKHLVDGDILHRTLDRDLDSLEDVVEPPPELSERIPRTAHSHGVVDDRLGVEVEPRLRRLNGDDFSVEHEERGPVDVGIFHGDQRGERLLFVEPTDRGAGYFDPSHDFAAR